ncbi:MAG TPA: hypothetical protein DCP63_14230 [Bacteroidetes bacterium]|nr:hypothetical protein [Bacteroidota bacterium]
MTTERQQREYDAIVSEPAAIIVHCSDPRFQKAFREFINIELGMTEGSYVPLVISGGVGSLSEPLKLPKEFKFMKERIEQFLRRFNSIKRIILINHEDCRHYELIRSAIGSLFLNRVRDMMERQTIDLRAVSRTLLGLLGVKIEVEMYYARFTGSDRKKIVFEEVKI